MLRRSGEWGRALFPCASARDGLLALCGIIAVLPAAAQAPTAPVMSAEPALTEGAANTVAWSSAAGADAYQAEAADNPAFSPVIANSGWIAGLSHEFTGLSLGVTYYYRVKAGALEPGATASWSQSSAAEFVSGTLGNTATTGLDRVELAPDTPTEHIDATGGTTSSFSLNNARLNVIQADKDATLTKIEAYLSFTGANELQFLVYENTTFSGTYTRIHSSTVPVTGTGPGFYGSGSLNVALQAGRYYMIGAAWQQSVTYYQGTGVSPAFGTHKGYKITTASYPLGTSLSSPTTQSTAYYFRMTTLVSDTYVSPGTIISPVIAPSPILTWNTLTFNGATPANTALSVDLLPAVGDSALPGYSGVSSGADLSGLAEAAVRLRANLSTSDPAHTPALDDWTLTWQETPDTYVESSFSTVVSSTQDAAVAGSDLWVDFAGGGDFETGSPYFPYDTLAEGVDAVDEGGTVHIYSGDSSETMTLTKAMRIEASGGTVRVGVPDARTSPPHAETLQPRGEGRSPMITPGYAPVLPFSEVGDNKAALPESPLSLRLRSEAGINPESLWAEVDCLEEGSYALEWQPVVANELRDLWVTLRPQPAWPVGTRICVSVGGETKGGGLLDMVSYAFVVIDDSAIGETVSGMPWVSAAISGIQVPTHIGPEEIFEDPVPVWLPVPEGLNAGPVRVYGYVVSDFGAQWYPVESIAGFLVAGSITTVHEGGNVYIKFQVHHGGIVGLR